MATKNYQRLPLVDHDHHAANNSQQPQPTDHKDVLFGGEGSPIAVERTAGIFSSFINLTNTIIGSGVLGLPFAFANTGWYLGSLLMVLAGLCTVFGLHVLAACALHIEGPSTLYSVTALAMPQMASLVDIAVVISCFGAATSYLIVIGDLMPDVMDQFGATGPVANRLLWVCLGFAVVSPLSCLKSLDALKYTSIASVAFVIFLTFIIIFFAAGIDQLDPCASVEAGDTCVGTKEDVVVNMDTFRVFSIFIFAFTCHQNIFAIASELIQPSLARMNIVIWESIGVSFTIYIVVACCGYSTYGSQVEPNILVSYPRVPLISIARIFVTSLVAFSFPLQVHPARRSILTLIANWRNEKESELSDHDNWIRYIVVTALFLGTAFAIALSVTDLSIILSFVGATGSTLISFILPGFSYYIIFQHEGPAWKKYAALGLGILGLIIVPVCLTFIFV